MHKASSLLRFPNRLVANYKAKRKSKNESPSPSDLTKEEPMSQPPSTANAVPDGPTPTTAEEPDTPITLAQPSSLRSHHHRAKLVRSFYNALNALPIWTSIPTLCQRLSILRRGQTANPNHISGSTRLTVTIFGHRKGRITLAIQNDSRSIPLLLLELPIPTGKFMADMGSSGLVRITLECEKKMEGSVQLLGEPAWMAYINGRNVGYGARRDATEVDLRLMQKLHGVSMGAGVLQGSTTDAGDGEVTYMRAYFDRVVGNKDSETFYMTNPDENAGPEISIFFVRL